MPPPVVPSSAEFPLKVHSVRVGEEPSELAIPPPEKAELPLKVQWVRVGEEPTSLNIPPPAE